MRRAGCRSSHRVSCASLNSCGRTLREAGRLKKAGGRSNSRDRLVGGTAGWGFAAGREVLAGVGGGAHSRCEAVEWTNCLAY